MLAKLQCISRTFNSHKDFNYTHLFAEPRFVSVELLAKGVIHLTVKYSIFNCISYRSKDWLDNPKPLQIIFKKSLNFKCSSKSKIKKKKILAIVLFFQNNIYFTLDQIYFQTNFQFDEKAQNLFSHSIIGK